MRLADRNKRHNAKSEGGYGYSYTPRPIQTRTQHLEQLEAREAAVEVGCTWGVGGVYIGCMWGVIITLIAFIGGGTTTTTS